MKQTDKMPVLLVDSISSSTKYSTMAATATRSDEDGGTTSTTTDSMSRLEEGYGSISCACNKELSHLHTMSTVSVTETAGDEDSGWKLLFSSENSFHDNHEEEEDETNESEIYRRSTSIQRAMPERFFALCITLLLEIPVLMMVSGGSDALCGLIGRSRYQLLVGFLPLTSAISGNVGLQASTLTTRAISHRHVTIKDYWIWLSTEITAAFYLGLGMGSSLGSIAFAASGFDWTFGLTIAIAQLLSIVTAGITGTLAPLLFSFIFKRDSGKWGGPLETAVQDIVGSFAMVIVSYHILKFLGPGPIDPTDTCGPMVQ